MMQWDELYSDQHAQAFAFVSAIDPSVLEQARSLLDQQLEVGASFREARQELQPLLERIAAT